MWLILNLQKQLVFVTLATVMCEIEIVTLQTWAQFQNRYKNIRKIKFKSNLDHAPLMWHLDWSFYNARY